MYRRLSFLIVLVSVADLSAEQPQAKLITKPDAFATLVNPNCSHCVDEAKRRASELRADDRVLAWTRGKYEGGAIPFRFFLNQYRVISDTYGVFVYDPEAGYARGFKASLDFTFHGWRNGVMVMKHKDGTLFSCLSGRAFEGPRMDKKLEPWDTAVTDWGWYLAHYPGGVAYHMFDKYQAVEAPLKPHPDSIASRGKADPRLPEEEAIIGIEGPMIRARPRVYTIASLEKLGKFAVVSDHFECGQRLFVLWQASTRTAVAYKPWAESRKATTKLSEEGEFIDAKEVALEVDETNQDLPFVDRKTGSRFDVLGRCRIGELKDRTLPTWNSVQVKWFAWAAEYPGSVVAQPPTKPEPKAPEPKASEPKKTDAIKEVAGSAEFLRNIPKHFAVLEDVNLAKREVTLLVEGEKLPKTWPLTPDAEIKVMGWWGRIEQIGPGSRVWVWFKTDRQKRPTAVFMVADELSEQDIHGGPVKITAVGKDTLTYVSGKAPPRQVSSIGAGYYESGKPPVDSAAKIKPEMSAFIRTARDRANLILDAKTFEEHRTKQREYLREVWKGEGLPGTIGFVHMLSGELDLIVDHEGQRWARSLKNGDKVELHEPQPPRTPDHLPGGPLPPYLVFPTKTAAAVKSVAPWRERTQVRLVINGLDIADFSPGQRVLLKMSPPAAEVDGGRYPPDIEKQRTKDERVEWFLANIYCTCKVGGDVCTGHFYTLSSCNPNGCGAPNATRKKIAAKIDEGLSDKQIFDDLLAERGQGMLRPHLAP